MSADEQSPSESAVPKKRETLAERFERILGVSFDETFPKPATIDSSRRTKPTTKRRDQILQAQRSHRQRTQLYIRELEKEVIHLRKDLEAARAKLPNTPGRNGHTNSGSPPSNFDTSSAGTFPSPVGSETVMVDLTGLAHTEPELACTVQAAFALAPDYLPSPAMESYPSGMHSAETNKAKLDSQSAVDFVLALEQPCLAHVKYAYLEDSYLDPRNSVTINSGPAHAFNISSSLVQGSYTIDPTSAPFEVPKFDIDQLLATSHNLGLSENEITPVQIWASLIELSQTRLITKDALALFTAELSRYSRCNGFGTVIDKNVADSIFGFIFG